MAENKLHSLILLVKKHVGVIILVGSSLLVLGIILLSIKSSGEPWREMDFDNAYVMDYTNCTNDHGDRCFDLQKPDDPCICYWIFNLNSTMEGDIAIFYELESFNKSLVAQEPGYYQSRDDNQLKGILSQNVSDACGSYSYVNGTPIAPCGAIADAMFNDTISFISPKVPLLEYGIITPEDKAGFNNPDNFNTTLQNFSKPINWAKKITELDPDNPENNAFQNEKFIGWMKTEWTRKPWYRVNQTLAYKNGLPAGEYTMRIAYDYPVSRYNGSRKILFVKVIMVVPQPTACFATGLAALLIGLIILLIAGGTIGAPKIKSKLEELTASSTRTPDAPETRKKDSPLKDNPGTPNNKAAGAASEPAEDPHAEKNPLNS